MKLFSLITAAALMAAAACSELVPGAADSPVGPAVQHSQLAESAAIAPELSVSTTCQSFTRELDDVNEQLAAAPDSLELQERQAALGVIVADVCN